MTKDFEQEKIYEVTELEVKMKNQKTEFEIRYDNLKYEYDNFRKEHEHTVNRKV